MDNARKFRKVAVLMGGVSLEREVSLSSGAAVAEGLRESGYEVEEVDVRGRRLELPPGIEAVFIALHGEFGEDGGVQASLRELGLPYTGSDPESSALAFDKHASKLRLREAGVPTPAWDLLGPGEPRAMPLPVVVKPQSQGSSFGVQRALEESQWPKALADALKFGGKALVETYIEGRELTVGLLGDEALPVVEICAPRGDYNYQAKYTAGITQYQAPAPLPEAEARLAQEVALATYRELGARGFGRVDLRRSTAGEMFVLELNTIPGFTKTSLLPKAAAAAGIGFQELCCRIMESAML